MTRSEPPRYPDFGPTTSALHHATKPANQTMEVYRLNQADGGVIAINFARADSFAAATAEALFAGVSGSIHFARSE